MTDPTHELLVRMWRDGEPMADIARATGMSEVSVRGWASHHRDLCPKRKHGPQVDPELDARAAKLADQGWKRRAIARALHVSERTAGRMVRRHRESTETMTQALRRTLAEGGIAWSGERPDVTFVGERVVIREMGAQMVVEVDCTPEQAAELAAEVVA
jgi:transposase-like protein